MPEDRIVLDRHDDPYRWVRDQADRLAGRSGLPADPIALAEFLEESAEEMIAKVQGNLLQMLIHLTKAAVFDEPQNRAHWVDECAAFQDAALLAYRPSMRGRVDLDYLWSRTRVRMRRHFKSWDARPVPLPETCPISLDDLLAPEVDFDDLVEQLRTAVSGD